MRQFIIATATLMVLTAASSVLSVSGQSQSVTYCGAPAPYAPCYVGRPGQANATTVHDPLLPSRAPFLL